MAREICERAITLTKAVITVAETPIQLMFSRILAALIKTIPINKTPFRKFLHQSTLKCGELDAGDKNFHSRVNLRKCRY